MKISQANQQGKYLTFLSGLSINYVRGFIQWVKSNVILLLSATIIKALHCPLNIFEYLNYKITIRRYITYP